MKKSSIMQFSLLIGLLTFSLGILISFFMLGLFANAEFEQNSSRNEQLLTNESRFIEHLMHKRLLNFQHHLHLLQEIVEGHQQLNNSIKTDLMLAQSVEQATLQQQLQQFQMLQLQEYAQAHPHFSEISLLDQNLQTEMQVFANQVKTRQQNSVQLQRKFSQQLQQLTAKQIFLSPIQYDAVNSAPSNPAYFVMATPYFTPGLSESRGYIWVKVALKELVVALKPFNNSTQTSDTQPYTLWLMGPDQSALSANPITPLWEQMTTNSTTSVKVYNQLSAMMLNAVESGTQIQQIENHQYLVSPITLPKFKLSGQQHNVTTIDQLTPLYLLGSAPNASSLSNYILESSQLRPIIFAIVALNLLITILIAVFAYRHAKNRMARERDNNLLHRFIQKSPQAVMVASPNGEILLSNQSAVALIPRLQSYFTKKSDDDTEEYQTPEDFNLLQQLSSEEQYKLFQLETIITRLHLPESRRESSKYYYSRIFAIEHDNELLAIGAIYTDQTQIEEAQNELRLAEERISAIFDSAADAILVVNRKGQIIEQNITAEQMFGYSAEEFKDMAVEKLMPEKYRKGHVGLRNGYMQNPRMRLMSDATILTAQDKHGDVFPIEASLNAVDGKKQLVVCTVRDIRERQRIQQQLSQAQKMDAIGKLTGGIAHDFNNLLSIIIGNLDLAEMHLEQEKQAEAIKAINTAQEVTERATNLTKRLLAFARKQTLTPELVELKPLLEKEMDMIQRVVGKDIKLHLEIDDDLPNIKADPIELQTALINLAVNANDAMPEGGDLYIKAESSLVSDYQTFLGESLKNGCYVLLSITDTGTGIAKADQEKIFEPFYTTKPVGKGTGLGLSMVYGFMKQSGGQVKIYSELGIGTSFKLYFPAIADQSNPTIENSTHKVTENANIADFDSKNQNYQILIVDDEYELLKLAKEYLQSAGYQVICANSSQAALNEIQTYAENIDLVFSDVIMPEQNGLQLAQQIHKLFPEIPVIFSSGFPEEALQQHQQENNPIKILKKPYRKQALLEYIHEHLRKKQ